MGGADSIKQGTGKVEIFVDIRRRIENDICVYSVVVNSYNQLF